LADSLNQNATKPLGDKERMIHLYLAGTITMQGKNSTETGLATQQLDLYVNMPETGEVESVR